MEYNIDLDLDKGLFFGKKLTFEEKYYLETHNYKKGNFVPIGKPRQEECWIKYNSRESLGHTFLVYNIKQEIKKYTKQIKLSVTKKPDIVFVNNLGKEIAIEVETGLWFSKHKTRIREKFKLVKKEYGSRCVIVLTNSNMKRQYKRIAPNMKILTRHHVPKFISSHF